MRVDVSALPLNMQKKIRFAECPVADLDPFCWTWTGSRNGRNYGSFSINGRRRGTHRLAYELLVGPIPDGLQIDHLCRVTCCCNPAHLEPVTPRVNVQRAVCPDLRCPQGHPLAEPNIIIKPRPNGVKIRNCRVCAIDYHHRRRGGKRYPAAARRRQEILVAAEAALQQVA